MTNCKAHKFIGKSSETDKAEKCLSQHAQKIGFVKKVELACYLQT